MPGTSDEFDDFDMDASDDLDDLENVSGIIKLDETETGTKTETPTKGDTPKNGTPKDPKLPEVPDPKHVTLDPHGSTTTIKKDPGDQMGQLGWGGVAGVPDQVTALNKDAQKFLLKNNRILMNDNDTAIAAAFVVGAAGRLDWAPRDGVVCNRVTLSPHLGVRADSANASYTEYEHEWQKQTVAEINAHAGVPVIFKLNSDYRHVRDNGGSSDGKQLYLECSQRMPKARVNLQVSGITPEFENAVRQAISTEPSKRRGPELLGVLQTYGQFVATDTVLGGRITLTEQKRFNTSSSVKTDLDKFRVAAEARFQIEAVPVDVGGAAGTSINKKYQTSTVTQAKRLNLEVTGGIGSMASSKVETLGTDWLTSLDAFKYWQVIGFTAESVVPVTEFFPPDLKQACIGLLQKYFESQLAEKNTSRIGKKDEKEFADKNLSYRKAIKRVYFRYDSWMDSLRTVWKKDGKLIEQNNPKWHGADGGNSEGDKHFTLGDDEEIVSMSVRSDVLVDAVMFKTSKGNRLPANGQYGSKGADKIPWKKLHAPRIRGFCGNSAKSIDSIGLRYLVLSDRAQSRSFLLSIEPYLWDRYPKK